MLFKPKAKTLQLMLCVVLLVLHTTYSEFGYVKWNYGVALNGFKFTTSTVATTYSQEATARDGWAAGSGITNAESSVRALIFSLHGIALLTTTGTILRTFA